jgi:hypothetical protein
MHTLFTIFRVSRLVLLLRRHIYRSKLEREQGVCIGMVEDSEDEQVFVLELGKLILEVWWVAAKRSFPERNNSDGSLVVCITSTRDIFS